MSFAKAENIRFAEKHSIPFVDADYDTENWFARAKGLEWEPERGARCTMCFDMRFERTALYAHENGFPVITSCLWHLPLEEYGTDQRLWRSRCLTITPAWSTGP